jgi:hypothetical protein
MAAKEGEKSLREKQLDERREKMKKLNPPLERVRVTPASDELRKALKHPNGVKFPASGSVEWPLDQFTRRRIKDGSVNREGKRERDEGRRAPTTPQQGQPPQQQPTAQPQPATPPQNPPGSSAT